MNKTLTIIPAKAGSTRVPQKNIRLLAGKPLLQYAVEAAFESGVCGEIMVSTESEEVARVARENGASVPFMRPEFLGRDPYGVSDVCLHVLGEYEKMGQTFDKLIILLPTSPLRTAEDIKNADAVFDRESARFLMSVTEVVHSPHAALQRSEKGAPHVMVPCFPEWFGKKRHEIPVAYRIDGAVAILDVAAYREIGTYFGEPLHTYVMPWQRGVDIDTEADFAFAEFLIKERAYEEA